LEARAGIEPTYEDLQFSVSAFPKYLSAKGLSSKPAEICRFLLTIIDIR
jgi:hypothetical protein